MIVQGLAFYLFAAITVAGALAVIVQRNPVYSVMAIVGSFCGLSGLYVLLGAPFVAAVQIIIYAGAIMVLFLFVIMLIGVDRSENLRVEPLAGQRVAAVVASLVLAVGLAGVFLLGEISGAPGAVAPNVEGEPNTEAIGRVLFTDYLLAFEITSILLVIGVVGAVTLARHRNAAMVDDDNPGDEIPAPTSDVEEVAQ